jgi:hypothetical protein
VLALWAARADAADEPLAVIVSSAWAIEELTLSSLERLYLGRTTRVEDTRVVCFDLRSGSMAREAWSVAVLGKTELEIADYWIQQALTGGRLPPREVPSPDAMMNAVAARPGAIGYVPWSAIAGARRDDLRVLRIVDRGRRSLPTDADYPIRAHTAHAAQGREPR